MNFINIILILRYKSSQIGIKLLLKMFYISLYFQTALINLNSENPIKKHLFKGLIKRSRGLKLFSKLQGSCSSIFSVNFQRTFVPLIRRHQSNYTKLTFTCLKSTIETSEKDVKYPQS